MWTFTPMRHGEKAPRKRRHARRIITVCEHPFGVNVPVEYCGGCRPPKLDNIWMAIRREQRYEWLIKYPAWEYDEQGFVHFRFDDQFPAEPGRYHAEIYDDEAREFLGWIEFEVPRRRQFRSVDRVIPVPPHGNIELKDKPGNWDMFQQIEGFRTALCRILERDANELPIPAAKAAELGRMTMCKQPQLVIDDGVYREIVEWRYEGGKIMLTERAVGGEGPYRFPRGAEVRFEWTSDNVVRAQEGC